MIAPAAEPSGRRANVFVAVGMMAVLTLAVLVLALPHVPYGLHTISDITLYQQYAEKMAHGLQPYRDFSVEYPPLAVAVFRLPGHATDFKAYQYWFCVAMGAITVLAGVVTTITACRLWPRGRRAYAAAILYALGVALTGAIIINRYDVVVALVVAVVLLCLSCRWYTAAAFALGLGFALKLTPVAILPLVLILAGRPRRWLWPVVAFVVAAAAPFVPFLLTSAAGVRHVFQYHLERPLQIESALGTPMLFLRLIGVARAGYVWAYGSQALVAHGVGVAALISGPLTVVAVLVVYALIWRRRRRLRATPVDVSLALLALLLALMLFSKVLSPQYFIWIVPALVLVAARDRLLAVLGGLTLLLTQIEFPGLYWPLLSMWPPSVIAVVLRNVALLVFMVASVWRLARLPQEADEYAEVSPPSPAARATADGGPAPQSARCDTRSGATDVAAP